MATSKLKPIKKTLSKAISYIIDPNKTAAGSLVSSFGCGIGTADIEMQMTAQKGNGIGDRVAYHLMQSFSPDDDITPEKAHQIGMEFAQKVLKGKFEFVIATHIDKDHIHNHIIFNAVNFYDHKKYHTGVWEKEKKRIRRINDDLCKKNNLSVIENTSGRKGYECHERKKSSSSKRSWKDIIRNDIDEVIKIAKSFDEFLQIMESEKNYKIARRGSFLRVHPPGYDDDTYYRLSKKLGEAYTEEAIRDRIEHPGNAYKYQTIISKGTSKRYVFKPNPNKINHIIDISKNKKAKESSHYEQALVRSNIDTLNRTMNFLIKHNLSTPNQFADYYNSKMEEYELLRKSVKSSDNRQLACSEKIKFLQNYKKYHNLHSAAMRAGTKSNFYKEHVNEIILFESSKMYFERIDENPDEMNLADLFAKYKEIKQDKLDDEKLYEAIQAEIKELDVIRKNVEDTLKIELIHKEDEAEQIRRQSEENARNTEQDKNDKSGDIGY
ncbi:MAG: relaxase/mobilization nuclease domain-containing protein [Lachnospiraceae bacterium]|nr:relaxase/mobilization nuclease domain-containing protein [Lachnospiraceae bacterium]